ncbi:type VI secretion system-associated FHA domain protein TagH [Ottowia caeni]|uniref:type VI secretion system-associated FHA domain protein TagH n=1 Tax=Ottowia caeni TaxID=2870339 RepID=UPI001E38E369|nr:type VI secretion system-associated FHA domain protein TagH [Ottowia caeni]
MLEITVIARQGVATHDGVTTRFGPDGGTIGRANTNRLVLDDPERTVSRVHAQVVCRDGLYAIIDRGSNPMQLNGQPIGSGNEAQLGQGDRLIIGGFELVVSQLQPEGASMDDSPATGVAQSGEWSAPAADDPFADLLEGLVPKTAPQTPPKAGTSIEDDGQFPDPMGMSTAPARDPFADLLGDSSAQSFSDQADSRPDDLSDLVKPAQSAKADSIDALFGLGTPLGSDPLSMSPLADPWLQPNTASAQDPLAALSREAPVQPPAHSDHLPIEQFGFVPPQASPIRGKPPVPPASDPEDIDDPFAGLDAQPQPASPLFKCDPVQPAWQDLSPASEPEVQPPGRTAQHIGNATPPLAPDVGRDTRAAMPAQASMPPSPGLASEHELLAAFLRGLGPLQQPPTQLTPGLMERIGEMMRTSTEGTLQLLLTRQEFKHQLRAQATMIAAQANNPLKFSPTVEVALAHLLGPGMRGFMPAEAAMRDAYQDLRAHEFGVMVGMRAALSHLIERFEPAELEKKIAAKSTLDAIFSANRKAKLWDQFVALYSGIAKDAEDDFHSLFGKAFLKAYEEQMERLKAHDSTPHHES